jgi:hypothetical protein
MPSNRSWEELSTKYEALSAQPDSLDTPGMHERNRFCFAPLSTVIFTSIEKL